MRLGMGGDHGAPELDRRIERDAVIARRFGATPLQMKIVRDNRLGVDVDRTDLAENLRPCRRPAARIARAADLDQRQADGAADGPLDEGEALVVDQHRTRKHGDRRARVDPVLHFDG
ncbi:MAG TPA: hypothetical protein VFI22_13305, partial [Thermomicrobiales bacterium]|nr:hypothetical protein [Thermomicrobiales bacterium]